jgi:hypothetical protein
MRNARVLLALSGCFTTVAITQPDQADVRLQTGAAVTGTQADAAFTGDCGRLIGGDRMSSARHAVKARLRKEVVRRSIL